MQRPGKARGPVRKPRGGPGGGADETPHPTGWLLVGEGDRGELSTFSMDIWMAEEPVLGAQGFGRKLCSYLDMARMTGASRGQM